MAEFIEKYQNVSRQVTIPKRLKNQKVDLDKMIAQIVPKTKEILNIKGQKQ
nr:hypothetical protein [Moraxella osloensis]